MGLFLIAVVSVVLGCTPIEREAYNTVVASKAFLDSYRSHHPECATTNSTLCTDIAKATHAKDLVIDAAEAYCAGPEFLNGGACQPPNKKDPAYQQLANKVNAAVAGYQQALSDLRGVK